MKTILVTGAAGFIGSAFAHQNSSRDDWKIVVLDSLTYAGNLENINGLIDQQKVSFVQGDIRNPDLLDSIFNKYNFDAVVHFAAESHVDNSISGPKAFVETNILGTFYLLEMARKYWGQFKSEKKDNFRFLHVSTDEVFGELGETGYFSEKTAYAPNSPYSATKASSDHLVRAWNHTYGLPTIITNCSNNYGPRQLPEKLIPRMITCALQGQALPVYGRGANIRDWIHVEDHCRGIALALEKAKPGQSYCFGGNSERTNLQVVKAICVTLDTQAPRADGKKHETAIEFVTDRLGHDFRYAIDDSLATKELGYKKTYQNFEEGLQQTVSWYLSNKLWIENIKRSNRQ